jgi:tRNA modification GTPase
MRTQYDKLRTGIIGCLAHVEALIDFGEGEEFDAGVHEQGSLLF